MNSTLPLIRHRALLQQEYEAEKAEYKEQSERMGLQARVRRGLCWYPIHSGRSYYNSLNQLVVEVENGDYDEDDDTCLFEYGKPVCFFRLGNDGKSHYLNHRCTVSRVEDNRRMIVVLPGSQALIDVQNSENLGVQLYFDETSYRTMFHALDDAINAKNNRLAELRDIFAGNRKPEKFTFQPLAFPWLNPTQEQAVNEVLMAKDVSIVHGPPGTGKTTTLVEAIYETLRRETQVLVCAQSNMAVDWISEKLVDHGVPVLRIGNPSRVNDKMLSFTYERRFESHPDYPTLWSIRQAMRQIREQKKKGDSIHEKISRLRDRATDLEMRINASLFSEARVVACTLVGSANKVLVGHKFSTLFIDEAAQALEAASWIALRRANRIVLAGDHQQLPPTIKCFEAERQGLAETMMERIVKNVPECVTLLKVQYRMNDTIMQFSSDWFYGGQVKSAPNVKHRGILDLDIPMEWIDTSEQPEQSEWSDQSDQSKQSEQSEQSQQSDNPSFEEQVLGHTHSKINKAEALLTLTTLKNYITKIGKERFIQERMDVGVISPYKAQTQYLRSLIKHDAMLRPLRRHISVDSIDGFQGQERDIIVISLVRSNERGDIGFLSDLRRMNVAITRARMKLIIIGNAETLGRHKFYRQLHEYVVKLHDETMRN
jgi:superfamily I DNA and/or RNA helicase